jgi:hypothetical protein
MLVDGKSNYDLGKKSNSVKDSKIYFDSAMKSLVDLEERFPNSNEAISAKKIMVEIANENYTNDLILKFNKEVKSNAKSANAILNKLKGTISAELYKEKKELVDNRKKVEYEEKNKPISLNHAQFKKESETGMRIGKTYEIDSYLYKSGAYLWAPKDFDSWVSVKTEFHGDKARDFYEMRGKQGCFRVYMNNRGTLYFNDYRPGRCSRANWVN